MAAQNMPIMVIISSIMSASRGLVHWPVSVVKMARLKGADHPIRRSLMPISKMVVSGILKFLMRRNIIRWQIWPIRILPLKWAFSTAHSHMISRSILKCCRNSVLLPKDMVTFNRPSICGRGSNNALRHYQAGTRHLKAVPLTRMNSRFMR